MLCFGECMFGMIYMFVCVCFSQLMLYGLMKQDVTHRQQTGWFSPVHLEGDNYTILKGLVKCLDVFLL